MIGEKEQVLAYRILLKYLINQTRDEEITWSMCDRRDYLDQFSGICEDVCPADGYAIYYRSDYVQDYPTIHFVGLTNANDDGHDWVMLIEEHRGARSIIREVFSTRDLESVELARDAEELSTEIRLKS